MCSADDDKEWKDELHFDFVLVFFCQKIFSECDSFINDRQHIYAMTPGKSKNSSCSSRVIHEKIISVNDAHEDCCHR